MPTANSVVKKPFKDGEVLRASDLIRDKLFSGIPFKFLLWQEGLAIRRCLAPGDDLCRQGDPGNTAYLIKSGRVRITAAGNPKPLAERGAGEIVGEMACLSGTPRTATISATEQSEIWEIRRNVLDRLMRQPSQKARFEKIFRSHALDAVLRDSVLFRDLDPAIRQACVEFLRPKLDFVRASPGQIIFRQNDLSEREQDFYLVRLGHIKVSVEKPDGSTNIVNRGPGTTIGEIGILGIAPEDINKTVDEIDAEMAVAFGDAKPPLGSLWPAGRRTATCSALDHVEMARVRREDFLQLVKAYPPVRRRLIERSLMLIKGDRDERPVMRQYVEQGLFQGQSLLVLDLNKCTRCDECTRACVQQHGGESHGVPLTRMLRQGLHFGDYLVATSCRSCKDAYCMIGCPVDAIHRGKHQQIVIEDHCIGCGLCAKNCPYGNIWMVDNVRDKLEKSMSDGSGKMKRVAQHKAATCDLCDAHGEMEKPVPRCVNACPHDAAHRMTGDSLLTAVMEGATRK